MINDDDFTDSIGLVGEYLLPCIVNVFSVKFLRPIDREKKILLKTSSFTFQKFRLLKTE